MIIFQYASKHPQGTYGVPEVEGGTMITVFPPVEMLEVPPPNCC